MWSTEDDVEHRMGFEPMNTGFADQRVSHFAIGARDRRVRTARRQKRGVAVVHLQKNRMQVLQASNKWHGQKLKGKRQAVNTVKKA